MPKLPSVSLCLPSGAPLTALPPQAAAASAGLFPGRDGASKDVEDTLDDIDDDDATSTLLQGVAAAPDPKRDLVDPKRSLVDPTRDPADPRREPADPKAPSEAPAGAPPPRSTDGARAAEVASS